MSRINWNVVYEAAKDAKNKCNDKSKKCLMALRDMGASSTMDKVKGVLGGKTSRRK